MTTGTLTLDKVSTHGYTLLADANGGEEQVILIITGGQSGHFAYRLLQTSVDGGHMDWDHAGVKQWAHVPYGQLGDEAVMRRLKADLQDLVGFSPDDTQKILWAVRRQIFGWS